MKDKHPFEEVLHYLILKQVKRYVQPDTNIYDLGCGNGDLLIEVSQTLDSKELKSIHLIGIDSSQRMVSSTRRRYANSSATNHNLDAIRLGIEDDKTIIENASVVIMVNTLQYINPIYRQDIINKIYKGLVPGGTLILVEQVIPETTLLDNLFDPRTDKYIPYKVTQNLELLRVYAQEVFYQIEDTVGFIAWKQDFPLETLYRLARMEMKGNIEKSLFINQLLDRNIDSVYKDEHQWKDALDVIWKNYKNVNLDNFLGGEDIAEQVDDEFDIKHRFDYDWKRSDQWFKNRINVFSNFSSGGGSSFGYKLAGVNVLANLEADPAYNEIYNNNHSVKYSFTEYIQDFVKYPRQSGALQPKTKPHELYDLDILDGSPPCKSFSTSGQGTKARGARSKYRPGMKDQVMSDLFYDYIDLAEELRPKVVIGENVTGLIKTDAKFYFVRFLDAFDKAGYYVHWYKLNAMNFGVPQNRNRIFYIAVRKDLAPLINRSIKPNLTIDYLKGVDWDDFDSIQPDKLHLSPIPKIEIDPEGLIPYKYIEDTDIDPKDVKKIKNPSQRRRWIQVRKTGKSWNTLGYTRENHNVKPDEVVKTIMKTNYFYHYSEPRQLTDREKMLAGSWPQDYDTSYTTKTGRQGEKNIQEFIGESVPPLFMAHIATAVIEQYLIPINKGLDGIIAIQNKPKRKTKKKAVKKITAPKVTTTKGSNLHNQLISTYKNVIKTNEFTKFPAPPSGIKKTIYDYWYYQYHRDIQKNIKKQINDDVRHQYALDILSSKSAKPKMLEQIKLIYKLRLTKPEKTQRSKLFPKIT